jgi:hypothetical protein
MWSWISNSIVPPQAGIQLKTKTTPHGVYTPLELYDILGDIYASVYTFPVSFSPSDLRDCRYLFLEVESSKRMVLEEKVKADVKELLHHIESRLVSGSHRVNPALCLLKNDSA